MSELETLQPAAAPPELPALPTFGMYDPLLLAVLALVALAGTGALVFLHRRERERYEPLETREQLDAYDQRPRGGHTIVVPVLAYGLPILVALWYWGAHVNAALARWTYHFDAFNEWWSTQANPDEQAVLLILGACAATILGAFAFVTYYVGFRSLYPDLCRLDPDASPNGRPEVLGRLYARAFFTDGERRMMRLYYHQNCRVFPPQCDTVDIPADTPVRYGGIGKRVFFFPLIQRAPKRGRRVREIATRTLGSAPLRRDWREEEVRTDRRRKVGIVLTGAAMNPDVTQRKYEREATITQFQHDTLRGLVNPEMSTQNGDVRTTQEEP